MFFPLLYLPSVFLFLNSHTQYSQTHIAVVAVTSTPQQQRRRRRMADSLVPPWLEPLLTAPFFTTCRSHNDSPRSERNMFCLDCPSGTAFCFYCRSSSHSGHRTIQIRRSSYHDVVKVSEIQKVLDIAGVQTYVINSARVLFLNERPQPKTGHSTTTTSSSLVVSGNLNGGGGGGVLHHICETCSRTLLDPFRFCSLGCKLEGIKKKGNACFVVDEMIGAEAAENEEEEQEQEEKRRRKGGDETIGTSSKRWRRRSVIRRTVGGGDVLLVESSNSDQYGHGRQGTAAAAAAAAAAAMCPSSSSSPPTILLPTSQTTTAAAAGNNNNNRRRKGIPHRSPLASS